MANGQVAMNAVGWFGVGLSCGLLVALLAGRWGRQLLSAMHPWLLRGSLAVIAAISIALLAFQPDAALTTAALGSAAESRAMTGEAAPAAAGSMEAATAVLSARLGAKGGSDADWTLLAQSYDFLGRSADAELARQHKVRAQRSLQDSMAASASMLGAAKSSSSTSPGAAPANGTVTALLAKAEDHRRKREFKRACDVYRSVVASGGMTADAWADFADALASSSPSGSLSGEPAAAIAKALALDPRHTKALWLNASLAHEEHRYQDALAAWRTLLSLIPPGSSDARIVEANMAEATRLAGAKAGSRG